MLLLEQFEMSIGPPLWRACIAAADHRSQATCRARSHAARREMSGKSTKRTLLWCAMPQRVDAGDRVSAGGHAVLRRCVGHAVALTRTP
jgi:hypothetical protein